MKKLVLLILLMTGVAAAYAQDCYNYTRTRGISFYNKGEYRMARDQFKAAKVCPDKPVPNDLDAWIGKCNSALAEQSRRAEAERQRQEEEERRRLEQEQQRKREAESQYARKGYMEIEDIAFGTEGKDDTATSFYHTLAASDVKYLVPRIQYAGHLASPKEIALNVKIVKPDGTLMANDSSPADYTYSSNISVCPGTGNYARLVGYGNASGGTYDHGTYRFELWYEGSKIYEQRFELKGPAEATYLKVDNKTAVTSTYSGTGGTEKYYVSTDGPSYEVTLLPTWCIVTDKTTSSFTIRWTANNTGSSRSDWFKVKSGSKEVRVSVTQESTGPSATIDRVWVDHNYFFGGMKGMMIHVKFSTEGMLHKTGSCNAFFYFENGTPLKDYNGQYKTVAGQVSTWESFTPPYESTEYGDFKLFLPYTELHMQRGSYNLKFHVEIFHGNKSLVSSDYSSFTFSS